jgi:hypothetical protein
MKCSGCNSPFPAFELRPYPPHETEGARCLKCIWAENQKLKQEIEKFVRLQDIGKLVCAAIETSAAKKALEPTPEKPGFHPNPFPLLGPGCGVPGKVLFGPSIYCQCGTPNNPNNTCCWQCGHTF